MTDDRYKQIMDDLGQPNSRSLLQALQTVANEVAQEQQATVRRLIAEAKAEEREACAVLCEDMAGFPDSEEMMSDRQWAAYTCAAAIRNRSKA